MQRTLVQSEVMAISRPVPPGLKALAGSGDAIVILAFAVIGRSSHHAQDGGEILGVLGTATPFLIGWFLSALAGGAYRDRAFAGQRSSAFTTAGCWLAGCVIGCGLRSAIERHVTPLSFVAVALLFNGLFLTTWRTLLVAIVTRRYAQPET